MQNLSKEEEEKLAEKWRRTLIKGQGNLFEEQEEETQDQ